MTDAPADDELEHLSDDDTNYDTRPLWIEGTPLADEHEARLIELGLYTPDSE